MKDKCIILFVKFPESGKVKTRLSTLLNSEIILELYKCFVFDILDNLKQLNVDIIIAFNPPEYKLNFINWLGEDYIYLNQKGNNLGEKMHNAFIDSFKQYEKILLIGSDTPDINIETYEQGFIKLDFYDSVIGNTFDGGYYLIGFNKKTFLKDIFYNIEWSTNTVFEKTINIFNNNNSSVYLLEQKRDIDEFQDLKYFYEKNKDSNLKTIKYIIKNKII